MKARTAKVAKIPASLTKVLRQLKVFPDVADVRKAAKAVRDADPWKSTRELIATLARQTIWRITGAGVVASLPGAIPGLGTAVQLGVGSVTLTGETWFMLRNLTMFQLVVATLEGRDPGSKDVEDEVLIVFGLATGALVPAKEAAKRVGTKIAINQFNRHVSGKLLAAINRKLGATVLTKWGTKRGGIALGRLIPFGVGAILGGGMNYGSTRTFVNWCVRYYAELLPSNAEILVPQ